MMVKCVSCDYRGNITNALGKCQACTFTSCERCQKKFRIRAKNLTNLCSRCAILKRKGFDRNRGMLC